MNGRKTTLDMFIPEDRRQALSRGETLPARSRGAVLFADVSGFTRLTGIFSNELGPQRGAEALTQLLDPLYTELVNAIHNFRGSVIVISGDGITCWFDQDDGSRAIACAFAMQKVVARYDTISIPGRQKIGLGIKIALSVGAVQRFLVGDPKIQFLETLAGHELDRVVSIHEVLDKGAVAISGELLKRFEEEVNVLSWRQTPECGRFAVIGEKTKVTEPDPWLEVPALDDEVARKWVYASIYSRIEDEEIEFLTELRQAVPLFVKFTGIDYDDDENAGEKLDKFIRCVQSVLERYQGYLCQLTIGGKGTNVFIAFGAPIAHEDNVNRALGAALKLKEETAQLGFIQPIQIGLTRGQLWAGAHGGKAARTYSVIGSETNLAHRLMSHAEPGQILVSPHVAETAANYSFAQLPPINFKGIEKPMTPFLLLGRVSAQSGPSDQNIIFGRIMERGILTMKLFELTASNQSEPAGILLIEGEAGVGKSRIVTDFMEQANQKGVRVLYGEADPVESGTQYYAFRSILGAIFNIPDWEDSQIMRNNVLLAMAEDKFLLDRAPLLSEILPLHWPDNELTSQMSGESRATSIREVVLHILRSSLLENKSEIPIVIILDDAQWLDSASWNLIGYISRELSSILLIVAMRPFQENEIGTQIEEEYKRVRTNPATLHLPLTSLSLGDTAQLVAQRLGVKDLPLFILQFIRLRSQGNPFFTEQVAYALRDAGIIHIDGDNAVIDFAADELNRIDFPATVEGIITSRIDRLSPSQQLTLKVASVIGRVFLLKILENVHPNKISTNILNEQLSLLTRLGITDLEAPTPELTYFFKHVITQEVIYNLLTFAQRKQLHCAIAEWYEKNYSEDLSPYYSRLAHHWLKGEVAEKAIHFLDKAGAQALELYSNEDVVRFISRAIELDQRAPGNSAGSKADPERILRQARWERMLGWAHIKLGHLPDSLKHYREALQLLGYPMPETNTKIMISLIWELFNQVSHRLWANPKQVRTTSETWQKKEELAQIDIEGVFYFSQNVPLLAWGMLRRLNLAEQLGMPDLMAEGYSNLLMITAFAHNERLINLYRRLTWEAVAQAARTSTRLYAMLRDGVSLFVSCEWEQAGERFNSGMKLADQLSDLPHYTNHAASQATSLFLQGKYEESLQLWNDLYQRAARKGDPATLAWSLYGQGHNMLIFGQIEEAILRLESSRGYLMKSAEDKILNASLYGALSLAYFRNRQFDRALENAIAHEKNATPPSTSSIISYYSAILDATLGLYEGVLTGQIQLNDTDVTQLHRLVERIPRSLNTMKNLPANKAGVWLYKGIYDHLIGKHKEAIKDWKKCLEHAGRFNQPYELARASYELGRRLSLDAPSRREYLERACTGFERLGSTYELNLTEAALQELTSV